MRKNYLYAVTIAVFVMAAWFGCYFYLKQRPQESPNGTFVELPRIESDGEWELGA